MTAPVTRTATDLDISACPRCLALGVLWSTHADVASATCAWFNPCPACLGTGQRHTATSCDECGVALLVPWSVDHTLAPLLCSDCACVVNRIETARYVGEKAG